jgi:hypothetical protein
MRGRPHPGDSPRWMNAALLSPTLSLCADALSVAPWDLDPAFCD